MGTDSIYNEDELIDAKSRTIDEVFDVKEGVYIDSSSFFSKPENELVLWRRTLEEAILMNKPRLVCSHCNQMVKLLGRRMARGKIAFFSHLHDSEECDIKTHSNLSKEEILAIKYGKVKESERHIRLKNFIADRLKTEKSQTLGVSNVEIEKRITSKIPYLNWRRPDVSASYKDKTIVFELQLSTTFLSVVVERDIFYRLNNYFIIWVFNFDENIEYVNLYNLMCKDIYYANKRNVFILDEEAQRKSLEDDTLYVKCIWMNEEGRFTKGELVSLQDLQFDIETGKPYYVDADEMYYKRFPEKRNYIKSFEHTKQELLEGMMKRMDLLYKKQIQLEKDQEEAFEKMKEYNETVEPFEENGLYGYKYGDTIMTVPYYKTAEKVNSDGYAIVSLARGKGLVNRFGQNIVPCRYKQILWTPNRHFVVQQGQFWKINDTEGIIRSVGKSDWWSFRKINDDFEVLSLRYCRYNDSRDKEKCVDILISKSGDYRLLVDIGNAFTDGYLDAKTVFANPGNTFTVDAICKVDENFLVYQEEIEGFSIISNRLGLYGFCDHSHQIIIPMEHDKITLLSGNNYLTQKDDKYGIITNYEHQLQISFPNEYDEIKRIATNRYRARIGEKYGIISNIEGQLKLIIPVEYSEIKTIKEDRYLVKDEAHNYGLITDSNQLIIPLEYSSIEKDPNFSERWLVRKDDKTGVIDESAGVIIPLIFDKISPKQKKTYSIGQLHIKQTIVHYLHDYDFSFNGKTFTSIRNALSTGDYVVRFEKSSYDLWSSWRTIEGFSILDKNFQTLYEKVDLTIGDNFVDGRLFVSNSYGSAYLNESYVELPEEEQSIGDGFTLFKIWGKYGIRKGDVEVCAPTYSDISKLEDFGYLAETDAGYSSYFSLLGNSFQLLVNGVNRNIYHIEKWNENENFLLLKGEDDNVGLASKNGIIFPCEYEEITPKGKYIFRGSKLIKHERRWHYDEYYVFDYFNIHGEKLYYHIINHLTESYFAGQKGDKFMLLDEYGRAVSNMRFNQLKVEDGKIKALLINKWVDPLATSVETTTDEQSPIKGVITNITKFGLFVYLDGRGTGLLHWNKIKKNNSNPPKYNKGDNITVVISKVRDDGKIQLDLPPMTSI